MAKIANIIYYIVGISFLVQPSTCIEVQEKVICPRRNYITCNSGTTIRVVEAIYGRVIGRNQCSGITPQSNCTADLTCFVSDKSNKKVSSHWLYTSSSTSGYPDPDPCPGKSKHIIVKYMCGKWDYKLEGENFAFKKPAVQSSLPDTYWGGLPSKAVDGNTNMKIIYNESKLHSASCVYTLKTPSPSWWRVDLEQRIAVSHVKIYNRESSWGKKICGFEVRIGDTTAKNGIENPRCGRFSFIRNNDDDVVACEPPLVGRYVTIVLAGKSEHLMMCEVEVYGKSVLGFICDQPLLIDTTKYPDSSFSASAHRGSDYLPKFGRLYSSRPWCLPDNHFNKKQYLQIDLPAIYSVSAVATVGGNLGNVTSYYLLYMVSGSKWLTATVNGKQLIPGNTNNDTHNVIRRELETMIHAQMVRFNPQTWIGIPCMRVELCGKEIPLCEPSNIAVVKKASRSVKITWQPIILPEKNHHYNFKVTLRDKNGNIIFNTTTTDTSIDIIKNIRPNHEYNFIISGIGLECFDDLSTRTFKTLEDVPSGPPKDFKLKQLDATTLELSWSPPVIEKQNGIITNYTVCFQTETWTVNCSSNNATLLMTEKTSKKIENLQMATIYFIWVRAHTKIGPGPYTEEKRIITGTEPLKKDRNINTTSNSFGLRLQIPQLGYSYIQIIVIKLGNTNQNPRTSFSYSKNEISTENKTVGNLKPYVTAELSAAQVKKNINFVIGDERNYERLSTTRRRRREDNGEITSFYNRPLEAGLFYSAFQRTFKDEDTYYSSSWTEPIQTVSLTGEKEASSSSGTGLYVGVGVGLVFLIIIVAVVVVIILKRKRRESKPDKYKDTTLHNVALGQLAGDSENGNDNNVVRYTEDDTDSETEVAENLTEQETIYGNSNVNNTRDTYRMVPVDDFQDYVKDMEKNDNYGFKQQYEGLPQGVAFPCKIAKRREHKPHNRYVNMVSYDDALVQLSGEDGNNYINASFIEGAAPKTYIATQGPSPRTVIPFWKMVWEQDSNVIIMLTNLKEKEKVKCEKYWPEKTKKYGEITVTCQSIQLFPHYITRTFLIAKGEEKKNVIQFHFTAWPDHGLPKYPTQLLAFQHCIRVICYRISGPIICHCSAGIGRTGAFIAIDHVLQKLSVQRNRSIDVLGILQGMRRCRVNMVQTLDQYVFIHEAILEYILCGVNEIEGYSLEETAEKLEQRSEITKKTGFQELFERLKKLSPVLTKDECKTATLKENSKRNRTQQIYPADGARVTLLRHISKESSDYINATYVNGYKDVNAYIATDHPFTYTLAEFWQMVYEYHSPVIVMLNNFKEKNEKYPEYFPNEVAKSMKCGDYFVRLEEQKKENATIFRKFLLSKSSSFVPSNTVRHFQYTQWQKGGVPSNNDDIIKLIENTEKAKRQNDQGPTIVHSGTGAGRTGTFLSARICMERLKAEQRVDIFQCIKLIREKRPQFVENADQLEFCYKLLARYVALFEGYSNFDASELQ